VKNGSTPGYTGLLNKVVYVDPTITRKDSACIEFLGGIGDFVWHDYDYDGIQDAGEPGVEGVEVKLYTAKRFTLITDYYY
jgi:hypothetical protein